MEATYIFPHQLFWPHPAVAKGRRVVLIEEHLFFSQYPFHKKKLILHRASMKSYQTRLLDAGYRVDYVSANDFNSLEELLRKCKEEGIMVWHGCRVDDYLLNRRLTRYTTKLGLQWKAYPSPMFLNTPEEFLNLNGGTRKYFMASFYQRQRRHLQILVDGMGNPVGGKWSFDEENRKRLAKGVRIPKEMAWPKNPEIEQAINHIDIYYKNNVGEAKNFDYPITHAQALQQLDDFLENRMTLFGDYEDAIVEKETVLFHSRLTPALNIGLITPNQVLTRLWEHHRQKNFPLNSLEGFVRQVIGWREFMKGVYDNEGVYQRTRNYHEFSRQIPKKFWEGNTGIPPIDSTISKVKQHAYCHHIERLMVLGNLMYLCGFDPDEVYMWFMTFFIDAYDWVMVPNVYGMSQQADGGLITTKPYISGSNYLMKMSNYKRGPWTTVWDGLYWRYIHLNQERLVKNQRMKMMVSLLHKMDAAKLKTHLVAADNFLADFD